MLDLLWGVTLLVVGVGLLWISALLLTYAAFRVWALWERRR